ncbi:MAG: MFS transporter [Lachnospiraceae bacterium]|nr:MFS transporter [Lachnospiraceae bacterium]
MDKQTKLNMWMFPLGTVGRDMMYQLFTGFILTYIMFTRQLTPGQLGAITVIMVAARIFDGFNDPIMGNIIDRTRTKWGKFKPWLLIGILTTSVVIYAAFNSTLQGDAFIWFFGVIYFLYSITYTMHDISFWGMIPSLGKDGGVRDTISSRTALFAGVGGTAASVFIPLLTAGGMTIGGNTAYAYGKVALVIALLGPVFMCATLFGVKEDRSYEKEQVPPVSFKKIISVVTHNDQLRWIALALLLQQVGQNIILNGLGSMYIYFEFGYEGGLWSLFTTIGMMATAFLMIFYPNISRKIHRKPFMWQMLLVAGAGYLLMFGAGALMPTNMVKFWVMTIGYMLSNFGFYAFYLIMMISVMNTVEYNEWKNGERNDAIITSLRPFITKLASAICVAIVTLTYVIFGVTGYTNQISSLEQEASLGTITETAKLDAIAGVIGQIQPGQKVGMLVFITLIPLALMIASYLVYKKKYILDEEKYDAICAELAAKEAEN